MQNLVVKKGRKKGSKKSESEKMVSEIETKIASEIDAEMVDSVLAAEVAKKEAERLKAEVKSRVQSALKVIANSGKLNSVDFDYLIDNARIGHFENREFFVRKNAVDYQAKFDGLVCELIRKDTKNESLSAPLRQLVVKGSCEKWLENKGFEILNDGGKEFKKELAETVRVIAAKKAKANEIDKLSEKFVGAKLDTRVYRMAIKIKMA
jgi:hypothetical protein